MGPQKDRRGRNVARNDRILRCFQKLCKIDCSFYSVFWACLVKIWSKHTVFWDPFSENTVFYRSFWASKAILGHLGPQKGFLGGQNGHLRAQKPRKIRCFLKMRSNLQCVLAYLGHFAVRFWPQKPITVQFTGQNSQNWPNLGKIGQNTLSFWLTVKKIP